MAQAGFAALSAQLEHVMAPLADKTVDWQALLALLVGIGAAFITLRVGSRVLKEFGCGACWTKREPLLPMLARRSDAPQRRDRR